jgi:predicted site-specific integrase-resolvase
MMAKSEQPQQTITNRIFSVNQLCEELSVSRQTLHNWEKSGLIKSRTIGGRRFFLGSDILDAFNSNSK